MIQIHPFYYCSRLQSGQVIQTESIECRLEGMHD